MSGREWVEKIKADMGLLPRKVAEGYVRDYGLSEYDASSLTQNKATMIYFQNVVAAGNIPVNPKTVCNWIMGDVARRLNAEEFEYQEYANVTPAQLYLLLIRVADNTISNNAAKQVFDAMWNGEDTDVDAIIEAKGLKQISDSGELEKIIDDVLAANVKNVEEIKAGNTKAMNALVGQAMKATKGKANPAQVNELLKQKIG